MAQLSLPLWLGSEQNETFASFQAGDNGLLLAALRYMLAPGHGGYLYFWSSRGGGCSHLLNAACAELALRSDAAAYFPLRDGGTLAPDALEGMEYLPLVCLDDIGAIAGNSIWEMAVFNLFNRMRTQANSRLLISGNAPPRQLGLHLPDLASRLDWGQIYRLQPLADEDKLQALQLRARLRGFDLPDDVGCFLLKRLDRDMRALCQTLDALDKASIVAQRKLTIPFVKEILKL